MEGLLVRDSLLVESLCCVLGQDTLSVVSTGSTQKDRKWSRHD